MLMGLQTSRSTTQPHTAQATGDGSCELVQYVAKAAPYTPTTHSTAQQNRISMYSKRDPRRNFH